jgi:hypothetical protein
MTIAAWPELPYDDWKDTCDTLHLWTQIVGKIRMVQTPWVNHSWHVTLYVTPCGLTTSAIPHGARTFQMEFDFHDHVLVILTSDGLRKSIALEPKSVCRILSRGDGRARRAVSAGAHHDDAERDSGRHSVR